MIGYKLGPNPLGATHVVQLTYADVAAKGANTDVSTLSVLPGTTSSAWPTAGTTGTDTLPIGTKVECVGMKLVTPFNGTGTCDLTVSLGIAGATTALLAATQVALDSTEIYYAPGSGAALALTAADTIDVTVTPTTVNNDAYTVGEVWFYFKVDDLTQFNEQL